MSADEPTPQQPAPTNDHSWIYWTIGAVVIVLTIIGLITYSGKKEDQEAKAKAQQLTQQLQKAGLPVPQDQDIIVRSLGTDGGNVCDNPASALGKAVLYDQITNGADFVGRRPIIIDRKIILGEALILQTYCPDKLKDYRDKIQDKLKFDDTLKD
jgi:hypothetical protein